MHRWEEVKISNFAGPLDLLLTMVREKKISLLKLNLVELTHQYLDYLNLQQELDIEIASEYLLMAVSLVEMKSKLLLPSENENSDDEGYSYEDFVEQLARYEQFRSVSDFFNRAQEDYFATRSPKKSTRKYEFKKVADEAFDDELDENFDFNIDSLSGIYKRALEKYLKNSKNDDEYGDFDLGEDFNTIENEILSPKDVSNLILEKMKSSRLDEWSIFEILSSGMVSLTNLISVFLATLDLVKYQIVSIREDEEKNDLYLRFTQFALDNPDDLMSGLEVEVYE